VKWGAVNSKLADRGVPEPGRARRKASSCGGARRRRATLSGRPSNVARNQIATVEKTCQAHYPRYNPLHREPDKGGTGQGRPLNSPLGRPRHSLSNVKRNATSLEKMPSSKAWPHASDDVLTEPVVLSHVLAG
jgi:hypothetical protein